MPPASSTTSTPAAMSQGLRRYSQYASAMPEEGARNIVLGGVQNIPQGVSRCSQHASTMPAGGAEEGNRFCHVGREGAVASYQACSRCSLPSPGKA